MAIHTLPSHDPPARLSRFDLNRWLLNSLAVATMSLAGSFTAIASPPNDSPRAVSSGSDRWFTRVGTVGAFYNSSARISAGGVDLPGASAHARSNVTVIMDIGYDVTDNVAVMLMLGIPPRTALDGRGDIAALGNLGAVRYGPVFLTGIYRLPERAGFRPYIGAGLARALILKEHDGSVSNLKVHDNSGPAVQIGVEYRASEKLTIFADYKHLWLDLNATGDLGPAPIKAKVKLDPDLISAGVKFRF